MTQRDRGEPCGICGFPPQAGIHLPALTGSRKGQPYGHAFEPPFDKSIDMTCTECFSDPCKPDCLGGR